MNYDHDDVRLVIDPKRKDAIDRYEFLLKRFEIQWRQHALVCPFPDDVEMHDILDEMEVLARTVEDPEIRFRLLAIQFRAWMTTDAEDWQRAQDLVDELKTNALTPYVLDERRISEEDRELEAIVDHWEKHGIPTITAHRHFDHKVTTAALDAWVASFDKKPPSLQARPGSRGYRPSASMIAAFNRP